MAKRPPPPPSAPELTLQQMRAAIAKFGRRIGDLEKFDPLTVQERDDPNITALEVAIDEALSDTFGHDTPEYHRYSMAAQLDRAGFNMNGTPHFEVIDGLKKGRASAIERWSHFVTQPAKVDSLMRRMTHHEDAETVFG
ncbi:MAG: hypothetical protein WBE71_12695 [Xanthobacteraceae bacterium]